MISWTVEIFNYVTHALKKFNITLDKGRETM